MVIVLIRSVKRMKPRVLNWLRRNGAGLPGTLRWRPGTPEGRLEDPESARDLFAGRAEKRSHADTPAF